MKSSPAVSLLLTNLRLLDYDGSSESSFPVTPDVFTSLKNKGKAFEHIAYHLFSSFDPEECAIVCLCSALSSFVREQKERTNPGD